MASKRSIPIDLEQAILAKLTSDNMTLNEISEWCLKEHNLKVSRSAIGRFLADKKKERNEQAKQAYSEAVAKSAPADMLIIDGTINKLNELLDRSFIAATNRAMQGTFTEITALTKALKENVALRISLSGINGGEASTEQMQELEESLLDLAQKFDRRQKKEGS